MTTEEKVNILKTACAEQIDDFDILVRKAWGKHDKMRVPFSMADYELYRDIQDIAQDLAGELGEEFDEDVIEEVYY